MTTKRERIAILAFILILLAFTVYFLLKPDYIIASQFSLLTILTFAAATYTGRRKTKHC